ncbi:hypothetical protein CTEN210_18273 [Chaetoceros tenuissimus]|uniref:Beta-lactamase-related domain-containing protein n=1 Tax=Chaetoceros tenuissimus TaxID=426638 RepID=A0AAD3DC51_9STRA|nr:hypothetical protein CTEN210_18273 [Chaetoceros tenuissimus]
MDDGLLNLDTTLGKIFPEEELWTNVSNADERRNITIQEMLTMTSGISGFTNPMWMAYLKPCGGRDISEVLQEGAFIPSQKGVFDYIPTGKLLSHVILKVSNQTPRELFSSRILSHLGIDDSDIEWKLNPYPNPYNPKEGPTFPFGIPCETGPEPWSTSLYLTILQMAKIGQLVLQKGAVSNNSQVISSTYIDQALTPFVNTTGLLQNGEYGFFWYKLQNLPGFQISETTRCAWGAYNQFICVDDVLDRISVQQADLVDMIPMPVVQDFNSNSTVSGSDDPSEALATLDPSEPAFLAMNPMVSFDKMEKKKAKSKKSKRIRGSKSNSDKSWEYPSESENQD